MRRISIVLCFMTLLACKTVKNTADLSQDVPKAEEGIRTTLSSKGTPLTSFGFAEAFIMGVARSNGYECPLWSGTTISQCTNVPPMTLETMHGYLGALAEKGVKVHKETVSAAIIQDPKGVEHFARAFKEYQARGFKVVLEISFPIPGLPNNLPCFPSDDKAFESFVYDRIANPLVTLFNALKADSSIDQAWLQNNVIITPWGEFDNVPTLDAAGTGCVSNDKGEIISGKNGSPRKAAIMQGAVAYALWSNKILNEVTAPSIANVYQGDLSEKPSVKYEGARVYFKDYYSPDIGKGQGRPNLHLYYGGVENSKAAASSFVNDFTSAIELVAKGIPDRYRGDLIIGESGFGEYVPVQCEPQNGGMDVSVREQVYLSLTQSDVFRKEIDMFMYWRLFQLNPTGEPGYTLGSCEAQFGVVHAGEWAHGFPGWQAFKGAGLRIFDGMYANWNNK